MNHISHNDIEWSSYRSPKGEFEGANLNYGAAMKARDACHPFEVMLLNWCVDCQLEIERLVYSYAEGDHFISGGSSPIPVLGSFAADILCDREFRRPILLLFHEKSPAPGFYMVLDAAPNPVAIPTRVTSQTSPIARPGPRNGRLMEKGVLAELGLKGREPL